MRLSPGGSRHIDELLAAVSRVFCRTDGDWLGWPLSAGVPSLLGNGSVHFVIIKHPLSAALKTGLARHTHPICITKPSSPSQTAHLSINHLNNFNSRNNGHSSL